MKLRKELLITLIKRCITIVLCVISICFKANAQQGCLYNGSVYTSPIGGGYYYSSSFYSASCPGGSTSAIQYAKATAVIPATDCYVNFLFVFNFKGTLVNYTISQCPLDDYLPLLFASVTLLTVWRIKR